MSVRDVREGFHYLERILLGSHLGFNKLVRADINTLQVGPQQRIEFHSLSLGLPRNTPPKCETSFSSQHLSYDPTRADRTAREKVR